MSGKFGRLKSLDSTVALFLYSENEEMFRAR